MKRSIEKIITIALVIALFVVSLNLRSNLSFGELQKNIRTIANNNSLGAYSCTGDNDEIGVDYYVKSDTLHSIGGQTKPGTYVVGVDSNGNNKNEFFVSKCTAVKVYNSNCSSSGTTYYRVSKVSDYFINADDVQTILPPECSQAIPTTTVTPTLGDLSVKYIPDGQTEEVTEYNEMYNNRYGTIIIDEVNIQNVAYDNNNTELNGFIVNITKDGSNKTSNFEITKEVVEHNPNLTPSTASNIKKIRYTLRMKPIVDPDDAYNMGQYDVTITYAGQSVNTVFNLVDKYVNFKFKDNDQPKKIANEYGNTNPSNRLNSFVIEFANGVGDFFPNNEFVPERNFTADSGKIIVKVWNLDGEDKTSNFNIEYEKNGTTDNLYAITITNKTNKATASDPGRPAIGDYYVTIEGNPSYSTAFKKTDPKGALSNFKLTTNTFHINGRHIVFDQKENEATQITRYNVYDNAFVEVIDLTDTNIKFRYKLKETDLYSEITEMSVNDFVIIYSGIDLNALKGKLYVEATINNTLIRIYSYESGQYLYTVGDDPTKLSATLTELNNLYPGIQDVILEKVPESTNMNKYNITSTGVAINYNVIKTTEKRKNVKINWNLLAGTGGLYKLNFTQTTLDNHDDDLKLKPEIYNKEGRLVSNADEFYWWESTSADPLNANIATYPQTGVVTSNAIADTPSATYMGVRYENDKVDEYTGEYTVVFKFKEMEEADYPVLKFTLDEGKKDYYVISSFDGHYTDPLTAMDPSETAPASNKKYEYNIGYFLMRSGGKVINERETRAPKVLIYTQETDDGINYYRRVNYQIKITKYKDNNVTYDVIDEDGNTSQNNQLSKDEFIAKYSNLERVLDKLKVDTNGIVEAIGNGTSEPMIKSSFIDENGIGKITYIINSASKTSTIEQFSIDYPQYYALVQCNLMFNSSGNIIDQQYKGSYTTNKTTTGSTLTGRNATNDFEITFNSDPLNLDQAITILPKTEVNPGRYYVYVESHGLQGLGYKNNQVDAVMTENDFPEMWGRNIHMTTIDYNDPKYNGHFEEPVIVNEKDDEDVMYANIDSNITYEFVSENIYSYEYLNYSLKYSSDNGNTWVNVNPSTEFNVNDNSFRQEVGHLRLATKPGVTKGGLYRLTISYNKPNPNGGYYTFQDDDIHMDFEVNQKYYNLSFLPDDTISYSKNFSEKKNIALKLDFISASEIQNIEYKLIKYIDKTTTQELVWDKANKQFKDNDEKVLFNYESQLAGNLISIDLTNVKGNVEAGNYGVIASYKETGNVTRSSEINFNVRDNLSAIKIGTEETPIINNDGYVISKNIYAAYVDYEDLEYIDYTIYYFDKTTNTEIDVSSPSSARRMFIVTDYFPNTPFNQEYSGDKYNYKGNLTLTIDPEKIDFDGKYYIQANFGGVIDQCEISDVRALFSWSSSFGVEGTFRDNGEEIKTDKFYLNLDEALLNINLITPHENNASVLITKQCVNGSCTPSRQDSLNDKFTITKNTANKITLKYRDDLADQEKLTPGTYTVIVYYNDNDFKVHYFDVITEYTYVKFEGELDSYSEINATGTKTETGLYKNKKGYLSIPVKVYGIPYTKVNVKITKNGTGNFLPAFMYDEAKFVNDHILELSYNQNSGVDAGNYEITISYKDSDNNIISDNVIFTLNESYFNFTLGEPIYEPNPPIANADPYGVVKFNVETEDIANVSYPNNGDESSTAKYEFARNTTITNEQNVNVTNLFEITAGMSTTSNAYFMLNIKYMKNAVLPGTYKVAVWYRYNNYIISKVATFEIADYEKDFTIKNVEVISKSSDGIIHNNVGGKFILNIDSIFDIHTSDIAVSVANDSNSFVTDKFVTTKSAKFVQLELNPTEPYLASGKYTINLIYTDPSTGRVKNHTTDVQIYGTYKELVISNMIPSTTPIYADKENQYYNFNFDVAVLTTEEKNNITFKITDKYDNLVYSDDTSDNVTNKFNVSSVPGEEGLYKIDILASKASVGEYKIRAYVKNDAGDFNISNELTFDISKTIMEVKLLGNSKITPSVVYNGDNTSFYDRDSALVDYRFMSNNSDPNAKYSLKVMQNGVVIKEITEVTIQSYQDFGMDLNKLTASVDGLNPGEYDIAICLEGLEYDSRSITIKEYIPLTRIVIASRENVVSGSFDVVLKQNEPFVVYIEPENATDKLYTITSSNNAIFKVVNNEIVPVAEGSATLRISHRDYNEEITINVQNRLFSTKYRTDYNNRIIYVNKLSTLRFTRKDLVDTLQNLSDDYKVYNHNNKLITNDDELLGTKSKVVSAGEEYTIAVLGDVYPDGKIDMNDVTYIFRIYRGTYSADNLIKTTARVNKKTTINMNDVTLLFRFYRGTIDEI